MKGKNRRQEINICYMGIKEQTTIRCVTFTPMLVMILLTLFMRMGRFKLTKRIKMMMWNNAMKKRKRIRYQCKAIYK